MYIQSPIISVNELNEILYDANVIIFNCTIPKVSSVQTEDDDEILQIPNAIFFDLKNDFSDPNSPFPNTILPPKKIEERLRNLGVNQQSIVICYDEHGIYSSPRVWWMLHLIGFTNVFVLNGGLPEWKKQEVPVQNKFQKNQLPKIGNLKADFNFDLLVEADFILENINNPKIVVVDARTAPRFYGKQPEPREDVQSGHIPNSINLPYQEVLDEFQIKSKESLIEIFGPIFEGKSLVIFSCGSAITACILSVAAYEAGFTNFAIYDGSWTEWGSSEHLPIATHHD